MGADPIPVMPSGHAIADVGAFYAIGEAPQTGGASGSAVVERPRPETAEAMLAVSVHVWNGGIFLFGADVYLGAPNVHASMVIERPLSRPFQCIYPIAC
ncbi:hypothetical protein ACMGDH_01570 [Sphingomonas sp. DT-207]|uniref:hypothetical protein n=1 Tax=Sphingomonas sp. DT-207 TaxID=3396167 RepID=UPI003F1CB236